MKPVEKPKILHEEIPEGATPVNEDQVVIGYTNYKGVSSVRSIIPKEIYFGSNKWHKKPQWLLKAFDVDKNADRHFAMADIHSWQ